MEMHNKEKPVGYIPSPETADVTDITAGAHVYCCGSCPTQGFRLLPDSDCSIICGNGDCEVLNAFRWHEPKGITNYEKKRRPRLRKSVQDGTECFGCARCGYLYWHLHPTGTITCYRCRHAASYKHYDPTERVAM